MSRGVGLDMFYMHRGEDYCEQGVGLDEELVKMTKEVPPYISKLWNGLSTTGE